MSSSSLGPHSPLEADWTSAWQQQWRDSLAACQPASWEAVALHLSMLGRHVVPRPLRMSREAFFTTVEGSRWVLGPLSVGCKGGGRGEGRRWALDDSDRVASSRSVQSMIGMVLPHHTCYPSTGSPYQPVSDVITPPGHLIPRFSHAYTTVATFAPPEYPQLPTTTCPT
jgi:hypothetical protein